MLTSFVDGKFRWGVCIDNMWTYAGFLPPKSIIIPHVLNMKLPQGPFSMNFGMEHVIHRYQNADFSTISFTEPSMRHKQELIHMFTRNLARHLRENKVGFVRCWFQWNLFQPRILKGEQHYEFPLDNFVKTMNDSGIGIIGVIGNGYFRFLPLGLNIDKLDQYLPRLSATSREIVRHYRGKVSMWQLENEPDWWMEHFASDWRKGGVWFERDVAERILGELNRIVKEEDPGTPMMINLEADRARTFMHSYIKYCDVLGLDFYPNYTNSGHINLTKVKERIAEARKLAGVPLMIAETGYPSGPRVFGFGQRKQAEYVKSVCEQAYSIDSVGALGMWRLSDTYWLSFPFQENSFGLINRQGIPKKAWFEYMNQVSSKS